MKTTFTEAQFLNEIGLVHIQVQQLISSAGNINTKMQQLEVVEAQLKSMKESEPEQMSPSTRSAYAALLKLAKVTQAAIEVSYEQKYGRQPSDDGHDD